MNLTYENFPGQLRQQVEGFAPVYDEHLKDYDQVLPHVLLGELVRFLINRVNEAGAADPAVGSALALLERAVKSDDERLRNLTVVSFLENLDPDAEAARELRERLGPTLRSQLPKP